MSFLMVGELKHDSIQLNSCLNSDYSSQTYGCQQDRQNISKNGIQQPYPISIRYCNLHITKKQHSIKKGGYSSLFLCRYLNNIPLHSIKFHKHFLPLLIAPLLHAIPSLLFTTCIHPIRYIFCNKSTVTRCRAAHSP